jgi:hypothetical protein
MENQTKELILNTVNDLVMNFLYYDRKEDEELGVGAIEAEISAGEITVDEIVAKFREVLEHSLA